MKHRRGICLLIGLTLGCIALLGSYFVGRNWDSFTIPLSAVPPNSEAVQIETVAPITPLLNINTATFEQLQTLPGIGPALAQRILDYRVQNGHFASVAELTNVEGIGIKRLESLLDYITTGG